MQRPQLLLRLAIVGALGLAAACGGTETAATPQEHLRVAMETLKGGDSSGAADHFQSAIDALGDDTGSPIFKQAVLGRIDALASGDTMAAKDAFADAQTEHPELFDSGDWGKAASSIAAAGDYQTSLDLLNIGKQTFPDSAEMVAMYEKMSEQVLSNADPAEVERLRSLGYL